MSALIRLFCIAAISLLAGCAAGPERPDPTPPDPAPPPARIPEAPPTAQAPAPDATKPRPDPASKAPIAPPPPEAMEAASEPEDPFAQEEQRRAPGSDGANAAEMAATTEQAAAKAPPPPESADDLEPAARRLTGSVVLSDRSAHPGAAVLYYIPEGPYKPAPPRDDYVITTERKRFKPDVLAIPVGSTVAFPNGDPILHNVFSVSSAQRFDLGLYGPDQSRSVTFEKPGLVYVHCNVHHAMQADILILDTPWFTMADSQGAFILDDVPEGTGKLYIWHPRASVLALDVTADESAFPGVRLDIVRPRVPTHTNKLGRSYRPSRDRAQ